MSVRVTLSIDIVDAIGPYLHATLEKVLVGDLVPVPWILIEDDAWNEPKVPVMIRASLDRQEVTVRFAEVTLRNREACQAVEERHRQAGWMKPGELLTNSCP